LAGLPLPLKLERLRLLLSDADGLKELALLVELAFEYIEEEDASVEDLLACCYIGLARR
jgi:hypothetical protein